MIMDIFVRIQMCGVVTLFIEKPVITTTEAISISFIITSGDFRLSLQGGHDSKIMFIVRPLHYKLDFLHLHTLKIGLKIHVCALKILGLAMPMHMSTFHQDFPQLNF